MNRIARGRRESRLSGGEPQRCLRIVATLLLAAGVLGIAVTAACRDGTSSTEEPPAPAPHGAQIPSAAQVQSILRDLTEHYRAEVPDTLTLIVEFRIQLGDDREAEQAIWHLTIAPGTGVALHAGGHPDAAFIYSMSSQTLADIYAGRLTAATAIAKARATERPPLIFQPTPAAVRVPDLRGTMMEFLQRFFNPGQPERILLGVDHSRIVQGAHVIPLYFATGMRSAWYLVQPGQRINEAGDSNAYAQAYVFTAGRGKIRIGAATVDVQAGESYYVPPGIEHVVWNDGDQPLVLLWLAWGEGA